MRDVQLRLGVCVLLGMSLLLGAATGMAEEAAYGSAFAIATQDGGILVQASMPVTDEDLQALIAARGLQEAVHLPDAPAAAWQPAGCTVYVQRPFDTLEAANAWIGEAAEEATDIAGEVGRWQRTPQAVFDDFTGFSMGYVDAEDNRVIFACTRGDTRTEDLQILLKDGYAMGNGMLAFVRQSRDGARTQASVFFIREAARENAPEEIWLHSLSAQGYGLEWLTGVVEGW